MQDILKYSLFRSVGDLTREFDEIQGSSGTRIIIFHTRKATDGKPEFDYTTDMADIRIPDDTDQEITKYKKQQRQNHIPESDYSLRVSIATLLLLL